MPVRLQGFQRNNSLTLLSMAIASGVFACLSGLDSREQLPEQA
ncbi:hypothetical protein [Proteus mirabilis]|nr:hypothetical protein [Proteus mirabilis]